MTFRAAVTLLSFGVDQASAVQAPGVHWTQHITANKQDIVSVALEFQAQLTTNEQIVSHEKSSGGSKRGLDNGSVSRCCTFRSSVEIAALDLDTMTFFTMSKVKKSSLTAQAQAMFGLWQCKRLGCLGTAEPTPGRHCVC